jgi:BASS family bile acid:Na+ symporter
VNTAQVLGLIVQASIVLTVLGLGLSTTWREATYLFRQPAMLARAVLSMNVVMPLVAAGLAAIFSFPLEVEAALLALAVSPVPPLLHRRQLQVGGRREYVVGLTFAMAVLSIVLVPLTVIIVNRVFGGSALLAPAAVAKIVFITILLPLAAGMTIRRWFPAAERASHPVMSVAFILLIGGTLVLLYAVWPTTRSYIGHGEALVLAALAAIGLVVGHLLGGPLAGDRTTLALATATRHPAVALAVATSGTLTLKKPELAIILLYVVVAALVTIPYQVWRGRSVSKPQS